MSKHVVVLDYGSGNVRSAVRALEKVGALVELTADPGRCSARTASSFRESATSTRAWRGLLAAQGPLLIGRRLAGSRPVLGVCVGMQVLFEGSGEPTAQPQEGLGEWPGRVERLTAPVVPHGWAEVDVGSGSRLFAGVETERFYFVHSYAAHDWSLHPTSRAFEAVAPVVTHATHGERFVAAVENGPLSGTQFHPEKSGEAGLTLLENWIRSL